MPLEPDIEPVFVDVLPFIEPFIELFGEALACGIVLLVVVVFGTPLLCMPGVVEPVAFPADAPVVCALATLVVAPMVRRRSAVEINRVVMVSRLVDAGARRHTFSPAQACEFTAIPTPWMAVSEAPGPAGAM